MRKRVVITGMGALTPVGNGVADYWEGLVQGRCGVSELSCMDTSGMPCKIGAEVKLDMGQYYEPQELRKMDRFIQLALVAAGEAIAGCGLAPGSEALSSAGVLMGSSMGGAITLAEQLEVLREKGPRRVSAYFIPKMLANMAGGYIAMKYGLRGPNETVATACASAANAIGAALSLIRAGRATVMIAGGAETAFEPLFFAGLCAMKAVSTRNHEPARACRPFDRERDGMVMGEGAGVVVLEEEEHARKRGADILAELVGFATCSDGYHLSAPAPDGEGEARAMELALEDAGLTRDQVDYINAHGTSTPLGDRIETQAIKKVFGDRAYRIPISSTKSCTGHLLGAGGAAELIACVMAIRSGIVPPTINYEVPDPECDLDYVPNNARELAIGSAMSNSFGFGGQNACLVVRRYEG